MSNIPTAENFLQKNIDYVLEKDCKEDVEQAMIEFAKLHVKEALKEALDSIPCLGSSTDIPTYEEVEKEVLNSYPLENIK